MSESIAQSISSHQRNNQVGTSLELELLWAQVLQCSRSWVCAHGDYVADDLQWQNFRQLQQRLAAGEPLAYIVGAKEFWSLPFCVNRHVLVPRPESELLVQLALECVAEPSQATVADLGCGCGAIAVALAHERPNWRVLAVDNSHEALAVAQSNTDSNNVSVELLAGDWCAPLPKDHSLQMLIANPPYLAADDPHLAELSYEPASALIAGKTGLEALAIIAAQAGAHLSEGGWLLLEHGCDQAQAVRAMLGQHGFQQVKTVNDYSDLERVTLGQI